MTAAQFLCSFGSQESWCVFVAAVGLKGLREYAAMRGADEDEVEDLAHDELWESKAHFSDSLAKQQACKALGVGWGGCL